MTINYKAPLRDMEFVYYELFNGEELTKLPGYEEAEPETVKAILQEAAKMAENVLLPLNQSGDEEGCRFESGNVTAPKGFKEAYDIFTEGGWHGLSTDPEFNGMGLPHSLSIVLGEMMTTTNHSFSMYTSLTYAAGKAIQACGTQAQKETYLTKFVEGDWSGTMCLTEAQCGTDLGLITTKAEPKLDVCEDAFTINGSKIFISAGDHDLTDNIVHLVLVRLPDAPKGVKGISLFLVPKFIVNDDGSLGERNTVSCGSIEHKMGIKGSATSVMNFDDARGFLVGEQNKGLNYMFTMMNYERLGMGIQGIGATEVSYQQAAAYAHDRLQGRSATGVKLSDKAADPLIVHADVRRMLLTMRSLNEAGRCFSTYVAKQLDLVKYSNNVEIKTKAEHLVALLTPVAKAFLTDMSYENCGLGQMVFGGHGYVREWGQEQLVRDVRIAQIYEGTNGIQSLDLLGRKVVATKGQLFNEYEKEIKQFINEHSANHELSIFIKPLQAALEKLTQLTETLLTHSKEDKNAVGASATDYLAVFGYVSYTYMWAMMVEKSLAKTEQDDFYQAKLYVGQFFIQKILPKMDCHIQAIQSGSEPIMAMPADLFGYKE
mgnify:CR=1 FL=1